MIHTEASPLKGKIVRIKPEVKHFQYPDFGGSDFRVEDWWDRLTGSSWILADGNPAAIVYAARSIINSIPSDDEVLYGHVGSYGSLVHISELEIIDKTIKC